jgi:outer membrane protein OmpA-like peptidoglycan-associated protein
MRSKLAIAYSKTKEQKRRDSARKNVAVSTLFLCWLCISLLAASVAAQDQTAAQEQPGQGNQAVPASDVITKSVAAVGYLVGGGSTKVDLKGTDLMPPASGQAKVEIKSKAGKTNVDAEVKALKRPSSFGSEFLTYVLWVVTPEGRTSNIGEVLINKNGDGTLSATTPAQTFSLIVTAEPYFAVRVPSEMVVLQSEPRKDTKGKIVPVTEYKLMKRDQYEKMGNPLALTLDPKVPLEMYEARNAVEIAKARGSDKYAPEILSKAQASLQVAENALASKADKNDIISAARETAQFSEDARAFSAQRQEEERIAQERDAAAAEATAQAEAKAAADATEAKRQADEAAAEAKRHADAEAAEAKRQADEAAVEAKRQADAEAAEAKHQADEAAAEAKRQADTELAAQQAANAQEQAALEQSEREKQLLRQRLLEQFNRVLPTTDTPAGLVVNMADVLFDTGKSDLRAPAREALAKLSGIILNYPSLQLAIEGHTDSVGSTEYNQALSEKRADTVRDYLVSQGVDASKLSAQGLGKYHPVADNGTPAGRKKNRRVEIIVSGEVIGTQIGNKT